MTEKAKVIYVADDGWEFDTKEKCIEHEKENFHIAELKKALKEVREICKNHYCEFCPFSIQGECFAENIHAYDDNAEMMGRYVAPAQWTF